MLTFPSPTPLSYLPRPWGWGLKVEIQLFFQYSINTTQHHQRYLYRDTMRGSRNFLSGGWVGGGGGSRLLNLFYSLKRESNGFITHFPGVPTFSRGGGLIETHITITRDFPGGSGPPIPPLDTHIDIVAFGTNRLRRACAASF